MDTSYYQGYSAETAGTLPTLMAQNDWEIAPMDIEIMRRKDGSPWELGAGAFGKVHIQDWSCFPALFCVAVQVSAFLNRSSMLCKSVPFCALVDDFSKREH